MRLVTPAMCTLFAVVLGFAVALAPVSGQAGPYEDGMAAFQQGNYASALKLWRPLANQGNADAQTMLGLMYESGNGVLLDHAEAARWYRKAAEAGDAEAQLFLGQMYHYERGVPQDYGKRPALAALSDVWVACYG